jgi:hypothetical protein
MQDWWLQLLTEHRHYVGGGSRMSDQHHIRTRCASQRTFVHRRVARTLVV